MIRRPIISALACLSLALAGLASPARAQENNDQLKAALIFNILRFVDLGVGSNGTVDLCVVRGAPAQQEIRGLHRRALGNQTIEVRQVSNGNLDNCNVVYLGSANASEIRQARASGRAVIGDGTNFVSSGGMIGFVRMGNQIRFEVNISSARSSGIDISSKLLRLASRIQQ